MDTVHHVDAYIQVKGEELQDLTAFLPIGNLVHPLLFQLRMNTIPFLGILAFGFSGCYTQLYTGGYASRSVDPPAAEYARAPQTESDTLYPGDSAAAVQDSAARSGTVIVNNYYRESPYYRGYLVDEWEYPTIAFGFYSSRYRDYNGAYWWNDPWYHRSYPSRGYRSGGYNHSYPSYPSGGSGTGSSGNYRSDKRLFTNPTPHVQKGRSQRSASPAPAQKAAEASAPPASAPAAEPAAQNDDSGSSQSDRPENQDRPHVQKGRRR